MMQKTNTLELRNKANTIYKIDVKALSATENIFTKEQLQLLHQRTPDEHIHTFPKSAGAMAGLNFVTGGYIKHMLDRLTGGMWSFEIKEKGNTAGQLWVLGRLTLYKNGAPTIFKEQFGRAKIKYRKDKNGEPSSEPLDIGNDMKAAATDALKKCASELGIARDIYAANEFIEADIVDRSEVEDLADVEPEPKPQQKVDDGYKRYVNNLLVDMFGKAFDRMKFVKDITGKFSLDKLSDYDWQFLGSELEQRKLSQIEE